MISLFQSKAQNCQEWWFLMVCIVYLVPRGREAHLPQCGNRSWGAPHSIATTAELLILFLLTDFVAMMWWESVILLTSRNYRSLRTQKPEVSVLVWPHIWHLLDWDWESRLSVSVWVDTDLRGRHYSWWRCSRPGVPGRTQFRWSHRRRPVPPQCQPECPEWLVSHIFTSSNSAKYEWLVISLWSCDRIYYEGARMLLCVNYPVSNNLSAGMKNVLSQKQESRSWVVTLGLVDRRLFYGFRVMASPTP